MFKTKPLSSLKSIFPPIHQPLPLNKRESQQLLNALTTSFRKHLDKEHGWLPDEPSVAPVPAVPISYYASPTPTLAKEAHRRPTDRHLRAILSNPLFNYDPRARATTGLVGAQRDPMDVFDEAVAKGMMTMKGALGCLIAARRDIMQSSTASMKDGMRASGAGLRVLQWLRASGMERDLSFVSHPRFIKFLLPFLVAEGLDELAWAWLARLIAGEGPATVKKQPAASFLLEALVYTRSVGARNLDDAYSSILRGEEMLKDSPEFAQDMLSPWRSLAWLSTVEAWKYSSPSEPLFESYVAISEHIRRTKSLVRAHLDLHHPTKPSHALAVEFLSKESFWQNLLLPSTPTPAALTAANGLKPQPSNFHVRIMSFGLDTVQHLTQRGQSEEAQWILNLLRTYLGPYFAQDHPHQDGRLSFG
ncbi:hypothetical protein QBC33DRAFT_510971 [Phialemonium atrogriseum]|uniref:Uncharacterized protein n=1 Tax=Phialemonium atrogriseum TaxID=1093897 RepID=A0AAJ0C7M0_9PEZI|nr:uncharacterized protein QBC33DRAFT_510971 [Phialemonium atrogriseum]KAK1771451.1 hypothetical protein QBC33DRAFT_510971 [Phialemonium atrogriseum]